MFYEYSQNNSGGSFHIEMGYHIIIEANSADEADDIAEGIGIYFDGCANGSDCSCCGDRWGRAWDGGGTDEPMKYGSPIEETTEGYFGFPAGKQVRVVYKDKVERWY